MPHRQNCFNHQKLDILELKGMRFIACHGCLPEEKTTPQPFIIDATLFLSLKAAGESDDIDATVDYPKIYTVVEKIIMGTSVKLIETLAEKTATVILDTFAPVQRVKITVHKPESPLTEHLSDVQVTIFRDRNVPPPDEANLRR